MTVAAPPTNRCAHCGEDCRSAPVREGDRVFCCTGCRSVYGILHAHGLEDFYRLDAEAAASQRGRGTADYEWLDAPGLAATLARYQDETRCRLDLELPAIHCISCVWLLERLPTLHSGVRSSRVDVTRKLATIDFDPNRLSLRELAELLDRIGYPPVLRRSEAGRGQTDRSLLYRIGVAGFCFGNIMLLSFPEYLGLGADAGAGPFTTILGALMLLLILPVVGYAASGYFRSAVRAVRSRRLTLDLPIVTGILALLSRSVYEILSGSGAGYLDSLAGLVFFLLLGRWFQQYTFSRLSFDRDHRDYFPIGAYREGEDGAVRPVSTDSLRVGDVIVVRPGQIIPADGRLLDSGVAGIDYSFVTGESRPRAVRAGADLFAGGRATDRALRMKISHRADESYLLQLWRESHREEREPTGPPAALVRRFSVLILAVAAGTFLYWYGQDTAIAYRAATAVLIIVCPCALALATPFAYGTLQRLLGSAGYYLRGSEVIERLGGADAFVFDKTGTLVEEGGADRLSRMSPDAPADEGVFLAMAAQSAHPRSRALSHALEPSARAEPGIPPVRETVGGGLRVVYRGHDYRIGNAEFCGLGAAAGGTYACRGGRPLLRLDPPAPRLRPGAEKTLRALAERGAVYLISGDEPRDLDFWKEQLPQDHIRFRMSPFAKQDFVTNLQGRGKTVLMIGDGLNDAGALRTADVGLVVSEDTAAFTPASDGILAARQLGLLPGVLRATRHSGRVTGLAYAFSFLYNAVGLSYAVTGSLSPVVAAILMPLSSVTVVAIACGGSWLLYRNDLDHRRP